MTTNKVFEQAQTLLNEGLPSEAAALAKQALEADPDDGSLWQLLGVAFWRLDDPAEAQDALETGSSLAPLHPLAQHVLAQCYAQRGWRDLARLMWQHLLEREVGSLLSDVAAVLHVHQEYDLALEACRRLTEARPDNHQAFFGIAYYLSRMGAEPQALVEPLARAMDLAPQVAAYRLNLACVLTRLQRPDEAYALLRHLPLETIRCRCWLARLKRFFLEVGDLPRAQACAQLLRQKKSAGSDPPTNQDDPAKL